ncbi:MAG: hypothetical protein LAT82_00630 [Nanoarchaeota archaeon]|nr:hypothetical protein [Nanoarchaeota archaeon]
MIETALEELQKCANSSPNFNIRKYLEEFGFRNFDDSRSYLGINEFLKQMKQGLKHCGSMSKHCFGIGLIDPNIDEWSFQNFSIITPQFKRIKYPKPNNLSLQRVDSFLSKLSEPVYRGSNVQIVSLAYTIYDEKFVVFGTPEMIKNPFIEIGDGINIGSIEPLKKLDRKRLEELI